MSENTNTQARIGTGISASVSHVLADMEIRYLKDQLAAAEKRAYDFDKMTFTINDERIAALSRAETAEKRLRVALDACQSLEDYVGGTDELHDAVAKARNAIKAAKEQ